MGSSFAQYGATVERVRQVHYTAKSINATKGSRVAAQYNIQEGDIVTLDPFAHDGNGLGVECGSVLNAATYLACKHFVVKSVHPDVNKIIDAATSQRQGGRIDVVEAGVGVLAYTKANMTAGVSGLQLKESAGVTAKPFFEAASAPSTVAIAAKTQALALETSDTSTTADYKRVQFGGYAGTSAA